MKTFKSFPIAVFSLLLSSAAFAQTKTDTIPVSGNCGMCKTNIEKAAKGAGASSAEWNTDTKVLTVSYNSSTTNAAKIQQNVAAVGYDTRDFKAADAAYDKLHGCCKYERVKKVEQPSASIGKKAACCSKDGKADLSSSDKAKACCSETH